MIGTYTQRLMLQVAYISLYLSPVSYMEISILTNRVLRRGFNMGWRCVRRIALLNVQIIKGHCTVPHTPLPA